MFEGIGGTFLLAILDYLYVFVVLGAFAIIVTLVGKIVKILEAKKISKETNITSPVINNTVSAKGKEEFNGKLVSVITATVVSCLEKPKSEFKIINIKRYRPVTMSPWVVMGRQELILGKNINIK